MEIMVSSSQSSETLFDPVRRIWVKATPEERVRQRCLKKMIERLGFPKSALAVEKALRELPCSGALEAPDRRVDIVCFSLGGSGKTSLVPLLIVECKELEVDERALEQIVGYNRFVGAPCLALVGATQEWVGCWQKQEQKYHFYSQLPSYELLLGYL